MKLEVLILVVIYTVEAQGQEHPDSYLTTTELIKKYGYPVEVHEVTTEDGYILEIFRIPHGRQGSGVNRKPMLLMHGMYGQAENFIINGMNNGSLAYYLADNNFDVWIGNDRGTQHGQKHKTLDSRYKEFWNFSFHEMGLFDLPAMIDYILQVSKKKKLYYVGHSQGGTIFYVMCSLMPEYQEKIVLASLLAPGGYENHFTNPLLLPLAKNVKELTELADVLNLFEMPPRGIRLYDLGMNVCREGIYREVCTSILQVQAGGEPPDKNLIVLFFRFLARVSVKQLLHFSQSINSGHFRPWSYGSEENQKQYGASEPPDYPVENITVPTAMYYSLGDNLAFPQDIENICGVIKNCVRKYLIPNKKFGHLDFVISRTVKKQLYEPLLKFAEKYDRT